MAWRLWQSAALAVFIGVKKRGASEEVWRQRRRRRMPAGEGIG
jgi:hypothetical protein